MGNQHTKADDESTLIAREILFDNPEIAGADLSPDGRYITFMKTYKGILNIWIKKIDEPFEKARLLTDSSSPLAGYFWTEDSQYIIYLKDHDGDENYNLYVIKPKEAKTGHLPVARNLTPFPKATVFIAHVSEKEPDSVWLGINQRDPAWHDLYHLSLKSGQLTELYKNTDRITAYEFDWEDHLRLMERTDAQGNSELLRFTSGRALEKLLTVPMGEFFSVIAWSPDNKTPYLITNHGNTDLASLYLFDLDSKKLHLIESDPKNKVDIDGVGFNHITRKLIVTSYTDDKTERYWKDKTWEENYHYLQERFPGKEVSISAEDKNYDKFLVIVGGDRYASETYLYEPKKEGPEKLIYQYTSRPQLKKVEKLLSPMHAIRYKSVDGLEIHAYLTLPQGESIEKLPLVVLVHGGPKGVRDYWGYDSEAQFLANRGYAVLQANYRGSGGYGKKFLNAGNKQWGRLMQDDLSAGVKFLVEKGIVDRKKVVIMGGSYGGYATLAGLAFTPELYIGGVDIVGPSNLFTLLQSIPPYWEAGRAELYDMVGDPNTKEGQQLLRSASPLFSVDKIDKPLLIIQGANDPRVAQREADQIVVALRNKGQKVDYLLAKDEGHGYSRPLNRLAMYAEIEKFLSEILGGARQKSLSPKVAATLQKLRVDIDKVKVK